MNICDKAGKNSEDAKKYLKAIIKRLFNTDPHIAIQGVVVSCFMLFIIILPMLSKHYFELAFI